MESIKLFLQGEGLAQKIEVVEVEKSCTVQAVIEQARNKGLIFKDDSCVMVEDSEVEVKLNSVLDIAGLSNHCRLHVNRSRRIAVTVNYNGEQIEQKFPPSKTINRVKQWATGQKGFNIPERDAAELNLKLCGVNEFLDDEVHIGTLVSFPACKLSFDLAPKQRVEG